jgi:DNA-binding IclR family transcriptional regulator
MGTDQNYSVKATRRTFEIIETLKTLDSAGVSEIAAELEMAKTTVYEHLETLSQLGYVVKDSGSDQYKLGTGFLELGGYVRNQMKLYNVAKPEIQELAEKTGEHANLMVEEYGLGTFLYKSEGPNAVELDTFDGHRVHLQTTALGKAILANLPKPRVMEIFDQHGLPQITENTTTDRASLFEEFQDIRDRGYATDREERVKGMWCVAAPIVSNDGDVYGAVSVSGPKSRMMGERFEQEIPETVMRTANVVEVNLTYS